MRPYIDDPDFQLFVGDALEVLRELPAESVHCCVTSPPYWGLRDYGTVGQLGLEPTPDEYVANMVNVFREVRRVLRKDGVCFLNIADSYWSSPSKGGSGPNGKNEARWSYGRAARRDARADGSGDTAPRDSSDPGSACLDLCDVCAGELSHGSQRTHQPDLGSRQPVAPTIPDNEQQGSSPSTAPLGAPVSTSPGSSEQPPVLCWRCGIRSASVVLSVAPTSSPDVPACVDTSACTDDTSQPALTSDDHTEDTESSALAYLYSSIASRRLRPKDLCMIPQLLALALQMDGWIIRSEIVWAKSNPMPESVTDRPTKAHEQVWMMVRSPRYFYDADAIREPHSPDGRLKTVHDHATPNSHENYDNVGNGNERWPGSGRNKRSVWEIATEAYPDAHFATFPQALVEPCVKAGTSEHGCCPECGAPWERETSVTYERAHGGTTGKARDLNEPDGRQNGTGFAGKPVMNKNVETTGWRPTCDCTETHGDFLGIRSPVPCVVLDPFLGSGTTAQVARRLGRKSIGIELNPEYAQLAARRLQQQSLFA